MKPQKKPIHINAKIGEIAPLVILPGDPLRAKYIAENFLDDAKEVTSIRNMLGYTGTYNGVKVSVIASGMGIPSAGIYVFELIHYYGVKKIIRIGTCGALSKDLNLLDIVLSKRAYSTTDYGIQFCGCEDRFIEASKTLNKTIIDKANELNINVSLGDTHTTSVFGPYGDAKGIYNRIPEGINLVAEEMEGYAVLLTSRELGCESSVLISVTDSPYIDEVVSNEDRQNALNDMISLALESIIK